MKCQDFEQDIYLYTELSQAEKRKVDAHIQTCDSCKELLQQAASANTVISQVAAIKPLPPNHSRLTSNIMQAVAAERKHKPSFVESFFHRSFLKYAMGAASLVMVALFVFEQQAPMPFKETQPSAGTVTLNSGAYIKAFLHRKEKNEIDKPSLYACVKSGDCNNPLIENFKKKSL